jgi:hypothetical protein
MHSNNNQHTVYAVMIKTIKNFITGTRALICFTLLLPGLLMPSKLLNHYIKLIDFTGLVWILGIQPYNYPYHTLMLRPFYLILPGGLRAGLKDYALKRYTRRRYYRNL